MQQYCHRAPDHFKSTTRVSEDTNESSVTDKTEKEFVVGGDEESHTHKRSNSSTENTENCQCKKRLKKLPKYKDGFERVVFIDSTWHQVNKISTDERLKGLQRIELKSRETKFWRHQKDKPRTYLATIEAIYYFICDYHEYVMPTVYQGEYDNLLFLFCFMYQKIRHLFDGGKHLKAYTKQT
ncbi:DTW domain-containing protein 1 [Lamellibrachia satsuma]|nr:DTW domain-containing protein 1 [Lamellibrachia satsuma]